MIICTVGDIRKAIEGLTDNMPVKSIESISPVAMVVNDYHEIDQKERPPATLLIMVD